MCFKIIGNSLSKEIDCVNIILIISGKSFHWHCNALHLRMIDGVIISPFPMMKGLIQKVVGETNFRLGPISKFISPQSEQRGLSVQPFYVVTVV